jgi:glycine/D-amino acid oxidase-like deaminating enzyme
MEQYDVVIVGGGFFGCSLALHLERSGKKVVVLEKEADIMTRASYHNQARVHGGYHYSRSLLTALRSQVNFKDFVSEYKECIDDSFEKYYAIGKHFSKVSARSFLQFCERIGAPIDHAPARVKRLFEPSLTEDVFTVREYAFDSLKLRKLVKRRLAAAGIEYRLQNEANSFTHTKKGISLHATNLKTKKRYIIHAKQVFNCAYTQINKLHANSKLPLIPFKHELTEMALVEVPDELRNVGITIMDGPFFSVMPFPSRGLHTLSHVRYTPHMSWEDSNLAKAWRNGHDYLKHHKPASAFKKMIADSQRYVPILGKSIHKDSLWEVKTILPKSEDDDSRPILFLPDYGKVKGYNCIMGGKIDNIQEILKEVDLLHVKPKVQPQLQAA